MTPQLYEILAIFTSFIILFCAISLFFKYKNSNILVIVLLLSGIFSILMRSYRLNNNVCGEFCNHPLFYADVFFAVLTLCIALAHPICFDLRLPILLAGILMVLGAIVPHYNYPITACYLHLGGHVIICFCLLYIILWCKVADND